MADRDDSKGIADSDAVSSDESPKQAITSPESGESPLQAAPDSGESVAGQAVEPTVFDALSRLVASPKATWRSLKPLLESEQTGQEPGDSGIRLASLPRIVTGNQTAAKSSDFVRQAITIDHLQLSAFGLAFALAIIGTNALLGADGIARTAENTLDRGAPYLLLAFVVWLGAELIGHHRDLRERWHALDAVSRARWIARVVPLIVGLTAANAMSASMVASPEHSLALLQQALGRLSAAIVIWYLIEFIAWRARTRAIDPTPPANADQTMQPPVEPAGEFNPFKWFGSQIDRWRLILIVALVISSLLLWLNTSGNHIPPRFIILWIISSLLWGIVFAPGDWNLLEWISEKIDGWRRMRWRGGRWTIIAIVSIMILGASFRFTDLRNVPPEMTSDHVEKIQDAYRVYSGEYKIFFPNNGGREPLQMYLLAALSNLPGLGFDFFSLKALSALESLLTLPALLWMGLELLGDKRKKLNQVTALLLTGLVAVSYWHVIIGRQGLRIPFTPLVTALLLIYLARAMRHNRRGDFVKVGLILGFGLYMYQAVRMLPVVVVVGVLVAVVARRITWRERLRYLVHLAILVFVSLMVFLPMLHYSIEFPNHFWMRTTTRILGDEMAFATPEQAEAALRSNVSVFMKNVRNALLMFNWKGDIGWFNGAPGYPMLDIFTGAFLILGAAAWLALMLKSRDPVIWLVPLVLLIMLMPTILSLAHPEANPSNSRALGAAPVVYLVAALPIAIIARKLLHCFPGRAGKILALALCAGIILLANGRNAETYFDRYAPAYIGPSFPHSEAGSILRGFIESDGAPGNAFSVGFPFWWDYRALGIVAGYPLWPNDGAPIEWLPQKLADARRRGDDLQLAPDRDLLFFVNARDQASLGQLREMFPEGRQTLIQSYHPEDQFFLYRVPALGEAGWDEFFSAR